MTNITIKLRIDAKPDQMDLVIRQIFEALSQLSHVKSVETEEIDIGGRYG